MAVQATAALFITLLVIARAVGSLGGGWSTDVPPFITNRACVCGGVTGPVAVAQAPTGHRHAWLCCKRNADWTGDRRPAGLKRIVSVGACERHTS